MDFFDSQRVARKRSRVIVLYFVVAVVVTALAAYLLLGLVLFLVTDFSLARWNWQIFAVIFAGTIALIGFGSLYKIIKLREGGEAVARMLGGRSVDPGTSELSERRLLNVVEEIAIASGLPVPPVYVLDRERGINAFAAGFTTGDAAIVITRGCAGMLTRDELQGVIAHEFSHILNGDMRLKIRLMGMLHGILMVSQQGRYIMADDVPHPAKLLGILGATIGVGLILIGAAGAFCGRLIKAGVSRQREFLADAAAVQFTRNPAGLAGALKKIGAASSKVENARAIEASHLFFANALRAPRGERQVQHGSKPTLWSAFHDLLSTHPGLEERIRRLDPGFDGTFPEVSEAKKTGGDLRRPRSATAELHRDGRPLAIDSAAALGQVGMPSPDHLDSAAALISGLPEELVKSAHDPSGAMALTYALLLETDEDPRRAQLADLARHASGSTFDETVAIVPRVNELSPEARLPLAEMAIPALRNLTRDQFGSFRDNVRRLVDADDKVGMFEWALQRIILERVRPHFETVNPRGVRHQHLGPLLPACHQLLSALAHAGHDTEHDAADAFARALGLLIAADRNRELLPKVQCGFEKVDEALNELGDTAPEIKRQVLEACAACVGADGSVTLKEGELLRVIAHSLDCPMPPLLAGRGYAGDASTLETSVLALGAVPLQNGERGDTGVRRRLRRAAIAIVWCTGLLIAAGGARLFYVSQGYAQARLLVDRLGGEWVDSARYGIGGRIQMGPYVSVSFEEKMLDDAGLGRLIPRLPLAVRSGERLMLTLTGTRVTDTGLAGLRGNKQLHFLALGGTQVSDKGVTMLADCPNLEFLALSSNPRITDESLVTAGKLRRLQCLILSSTAITDAGLAELESLQELRYISARRTAVTEAGLARLREALPALEIDY